MQVAEGVYPNGEIKYKCASRGYTAWWQRKTYFTFLTAYILVVPAVTNCAFDCANWSYNVLWTSTIARI